MCIESVSAPATVLWRHSCASQPDIDADPDGSSQGLDMIFIMTPCIMVWGVSHFRVDCASNLYVYKVFQQVLLCCRGIMIEIEYSLCIVV